MKKIVVGTLFTLSLVFIVCVCSGYMVIAEENLQGNLGAGFTWKYDLEAQTLTIDGKGDMPDFTHKELNGAGFSRTMRNAESDTTVIIGDSITSLSEEFVSIMRDCGADTMEIGASIANIDSLYGYSISKEFTISPMNACFSSYDGLIYTKNYEKLVLSPRLKNDYKFHENLKIIGSKAIFLPETEGALVIPWGVTTIEEYAFKGEGTIVFPETVVTLEKQINAYWYEYLFPKCNEIACAVFDDTDRSIKRHNYENHWYDYYDLHINEWKTLNGKKYYFVESEGWFDGDPAYSSEVEPHMVTGWQTINGVEYYFADDGALVQDCWQKVDGKWLRFDEDGVVKKGFGISIAAWFKGLWG